jgi:asparagine synthase (glutamine-hydrolysing)
MCGIFGYFDRSGRSINSDQIEVMGASIKHRGPDDQGIFSLPGLSLGNQRLSVMDILGGHQPFISESGDVVVVQNGEIFNHIELSNELKKIGIVFNTNSDTEVILRLYQHYGIDFVSKLNGMFAIAIYDDNLKKLFLIRDRVGVKPLFFHFNGTRLIFSSEIKSFFEAAIISPKLNPVALDHFLTFNYVPPPFTIYDSVEHLMPGHILEIDKKGLKMRQWWDLAEIEPDNSRSESSWIEEFNSIIEDAVKLRLRADVPFGAFLSGGVDSSTIVGLMAKNMSEPVKTFCIGFEDPKYDESIYAQEAATRFNTHHFLEKVSPDMLDLWPMATYYCDQPHGDISFLPTYRVSKLASEHVKVVLTGDGGDELFAGYDKYKNFFNRQNINDLSDADFQKSYFDSISLFSKEQKSKLCTKYFRDTLTESDSFSLAQSYFYKVKHQDRINQALYLDMQLLLPGNNLVKPDRMGMAVSLEARTPFLDYRMVELAFKMPGNLKLKEGVTKYILKKSVTPLIGKNLAQREKQMFTVPVGEWFRQNKVDYCSKRFNSFGILNDFLEPLQSNELLQEHVCGFKNNTREVRALISLTHWVDSFRIV